MSEVSDDESQSRKRHWLFSNSMESDTTPLKKQKKSSGVGGFFSSLFGRFMGTGRDDDVTDVGSSSFEVATDEDDVIVESTSRRDPEPAGPIIFLNSDDQNRAPAGSDDVEEEVIVEKYIQKNVEIADDEEPDEICHIQQPQTNTPEEREDDEVKEIARVENSPKKPFIKTSELQEDDEPAVLFEKVVKTPNKTLQEAKRFENELIYLNETQDSPDDNLSVASGIPEDVDFESPVPEDSVSRSTTPFNQTSYSTTSSIFSTNNTRDFWRRSTAKKSSVLKRVEQKQQFKFTTNSKNQKTQKLAGFIGNKNRLSSRDFYLNLNKGLGLYGSLASGNSENNRNFEKRPPSRKNETLAMMAEAKNMIATIRGSGTSTPTVASRESSIIFDRSSAGIQRTPSISSDNSSSTHRSTAKIDNVIHRLDDLKIRSAHRGPQRYQTSYESFRRQEETLREEARIREEHRIQTREDKEETRKRLELTGIVVRPKLDKKKKEEFVNLPEEAEKLIEKAWNRSMDANEMFSTEFSIEIQRKDLQTLSGLHWLNDNIINFYLQMIVARSAKDAKYPKVYAFNTFFYTNIVTKGYASVKRWTRKVDLFDHEILLVPVHLGMHWCMAVIDMKEKRVEFYDSLYNGNTVVLPALRDYLASESKDKKKMEFDFSGWTMQQMEEIPRQQNGSDCGVFSCQFGEWASRRAAPRFSQKNMPYYRKRMVYEIVSKQLLSTI